ncbi:unnamed protein product [Chrysoparadoxa australica]
MASSGATLVAKRKRPWQGAMICSKVVRYTCEFLLLCHISERAAPAFIGAKVAETIVVASMTVLRHPGIMGSIAVEASALAGCNLVRMVAFCHLAGLLGSVLSFKYQGSAPSSSITSMSLSALETPEGKIDYPLAFQLLLASPLKEELLFRGIVFRTMVANGVALTPSAVLSGLIFGAAHIINMVTSSFTVLYVAAQVALGSLAGCFYSLLLAQTGSPFPALALHVLSNACCCLMPGGDSDSDSKPLTLLLQLAWSSAVYGAACVASIKSLGRVNATPKLRAKRA